MIKIHALAVEARVRFCTVPVNEVGLPALGVVGRDGRMVRHLLGEELVAGPLAFVGLAE